MRRRGLCAWIVCLPLVAVADPAVYFSKGVELMRTILLTLLVVTLAQAQPLTVLWDRSGAGENSNYGGKIVALGDQNNDGFNDFAVWALGGDSAGSLNEEKIEFFHGGNPPQSEPYMTFRGSLAPEREIRYFSGVGDVNGDGYEDWEIWWQYASAPANYEFQIFWGGPDADQNPDLVLHGPIDQDIFPLGDFNGDGFDDLVIYLPPPDDVGIVLYGGNPMDTIPDWVRHSPVGCRYQAFPLSFGDLNNDGYADFVSNTPSPERLTYIFFGGDEPDTIPALTWDNFDSGVNEILRDLNGDHRDELVFSSSGGHFNVHLGRDSLSRTPDFVLNFDPSCYPFFITSARDFNHDGYDDVVVVDDFCNNGWGTLSLYLGHPWLNAEPVITIEGRTLPLNLVGINNATGVGDVNGDGVGDLAIGAFNTNWDGRRGRVVVLSGDTTLQVNADEPRAELARELSITVFPNPFNGRTTVRFSLAAAGDVDVRVFDVTGREAMRVLHGRLSAGEQTVDVDASGLASGVYLLALRANEETLSQKLLLIR